MLLPTPPASAFQFDTGNPDIGIRWDNTLKYSTAYRLKNQSDTLVADANYDDGDRNFDKGLVSNRVDWLSELEANFTYGGIRLSGAAWYDDVYNRSNDNDSPFTNNSTSVSNDKFTDDTRELHGRNAELLDAFVYGRFDMGEVGTTLRAGRHTLIYGETLFFGANGIADAQGPVDLVKLLTVPSSQFKEVLRPVEQVSASFQLTPNLSMGAYYQLCWHESKLPGAGSYLSNADIIGEGSESWILGPGVAMSHRSDMEPGDSGQGGLQLRYNLDSLGIDLGLYAARYHAKTPSGAYIDPVNLRYRWVYAEDIDTVGASATGSIGQLNLATELSYRHNAPLNSDPQVSIGLTGDNDKNILYAVGNTFHANLSGIYVMPPTAMWDGASFLFELAYNRTLSVSENKSAVAQNTTRDAWASRMIFEPTYFQVLSGLDLSIPMGLGYNFDGRSSAVANFNGGSSKAGDLSIGINAVYQTVWKAGLSYIKYFGGSETFTVPHNSPTPHLSFNQTLADRDFIAFNISRAF
ncbi:MAG: DUF1302 domain-containing protein [Desulfuromonadales bacterium]|nr:DUF1302 domain-containing protein [Desulfuromonadales bacterium]